MLNDFRKKEFDVFAKKKSISKNSHQRIFVRKKIFVESFENEFLKKVAISLRHSTIIFPQNVTKNSM